MSQYQPPSNPEPHRRDANAALTPAERAAFLDRIERAVASRVDERLESQVGSPNRTAWSPRRRALALAGSAAAAIAVLALGAGALIGVAGPGRSDRGEVPYRRGPVIVRPLPPGAPVPPLRLGRVVPTEPKAPQVGSEHP